MVIFEYIFYLSSYFDTRFFWGCANTDDMRIFFLLIETLFNNLNACFLLNFHNFISIEIILILEKVRILENKLF